jgi:selenocysteine-specific elongation factor
LREEQQREMTIDLGFAYFTLPNSHKKSSGNDDSTVVGIVDVPGHIDFIENMLAGVGGIDAALLIIAADEGPMPQTREHLAILNLLQIERGIVVLTKTDLAPDLDWAALVTDDIRKLLAPTPLANAPIVPVSARQGKGLKELVTELQKLLRDLPARPDLGKPRLPIDRVFSVAGFGTVVTGTLIDGSLAVGDEIELMPVGLNARVRGLQTHGKKLERAQPGSRVAVNISGVSLDQVRRGYTLAKPNTLHPSKLIDVQISVVGSDMFAEKRTWGGIKHNLEVKFFCGSAETLGRIKLLTRQGDGGDSNIADHATARSQNTWAQLELADNVALARGDRFIIRLPSPSVTIGGGVVIDPNPIVRYRRRGGQVSHDVLDRLNAVLKGSPADRISAVLRANGFVFENELANRAKTTDEETREGIAELVRQQQAQVIDGVAGLIETWCNAHRQAVALLTSFHKAQPLADGMPRDTLRSRMSLTPKPFAALLRWCASPPEGDPTTPIHDQGETVQLSTHRVEFNAQQQKTVDALLRQMRAQQWNTPLVRDCKVLLGDDVYDVLIRQGKMVQVSDDVVFLAETYHTAIKQVREIIKRDGQITAAVARDTFNTSRKYVLGLLEHLDAMGMTKRVGDARVLLKDQ